jgi:uncharacterized protein
VVHFEVIGSDAAALQSFYRELFGWTLSNEGQPYALVQPGAKDADVGVIGGGVGGIDQPEMRGARVYAAVDDLEESLAKAESLGARRVHEPTEVAPGTWAALFEDPQGNFFGIVSSNNGEQ